MTRSSRLPEASTRLYAALVLIGVQACGGRSVDLQRNATQTNASDGGVETTLSVSDQINAWWVDDTRLYWQNYSEAFRSCVYEDCASTGVTYGSNGGAPLTLGTNDVFFSDQYDKLYRCPKGGCGGKATFFLRDRANQGLVADAKYLYWSSSFDIYRCPLADCGDVPDVVAARETGDAFRLQDSELYYRFAPGAFSENVQPYQIHYAPVDGSSAPARVSFGDKPLGPAWNVYTTDDQNIYWIDSDYHVQSCPRTGCSADQSPRAVVESDDTKDMVLVDDAGVYWLDAPRCLPAAPAAPGCGPGAPGTVSYTGGTVMFCPRSGCTANSPPRALTPSNAQTFALDSTHVYWNEAVESNDFRRNHLVHRVAKPTP